MSATRRFWPLLASLALAGAGACSLILNFDPEGQPCDGHGRCLPGYACQAGACKKVSVPNDPCGGCPLGQRCDRATVACVPDSCVLHRCPAGTACVEQSGVTSCETVAPPALGSSCTDDASCGAGRVCWRTSVQSDLGGGALGPGVCVEPCPVSGGCLTTGAVCRTFAVPLRSTPVTACLPQNVLSACASDSACADDGLVCTIFDHPLLGAATLCDAPRATGAAVGEACAVTQGSAGDALCKNGLCVPRTFEPSQSPRCSQVCNETSCPSGQQCVLTEFQLLGAVRQMPLCVASPALCGACPSGPVDCAPDAPRCSTIAGSKRCLPACTGDAGPSSACPSGFACAAIDGGARCVPVSGTCP